MKELDSSIDAATNFVLSLRNPEGMWCNFLTRTHGESADWVSSYVGMCLLESGVAKKELSKTAKSISKRQRNNGGFSYNEKIVPDADSTAFASIMLSEFGYDNAVKKAKDFILKHQNADGGFSTYLEGLIRTYFRIPQGTSVRGWCCSTPDVTASVLLALGKNKKATEYLKNNQLENGSWRAYWWNNNTYSTTHSLSSLSQHGAKNAVNKAQDWLIKNIPMR